EHLVDHVAELPRRGEVAPERLLDHRPAPGAVVGGVEPGVRQLREHLGEGVRRDGEVEGVVAAGAAGAVELADHLGELLERRSVVEGAGDEAEPAAQLLEDALVEAGAGVLGHGCAHVVGEVVVGPVAAAEADQAEAGRQQTAVGQVVDRRQQLLAREVAGDAEHHHRAGPCDEGHATVPGVAQRIRRIRTGEEGGGVGHDRPFSDSGTGARPAAPAGPCSWRGQARADSTDSETVASSTFQDFSNFSTPSRSSTANTSARSTPAWETRSSTASAEVAVCAFSAAFGSECSATAARVFSGMVLTVGSATRLST